MKPVRYVFRKPILVIDEIVNVAAPQFKIDVSQCGLVKLSALNQAREDISDIFQASPFLDIVVIENA